MVRRLHLTCQAISIFFVVFFFFFFFFVVQNGSCSSIEADGSRPTDNQTHIFQHLAFGKMRQSSVRVLCNLCEFGTRRVQHLSFNPTIIHDFHLIFFIISSVVCTMRDPDVGRYYHLASSGWWWWLRWRWVIDTATECLHSSSVRKRDLVVKWWWWWVGCIPLVDDETITFHHTPDSFRVLGLLTV